MDNLNQLDLDQFWFEVENKLAIADTANDKQVVRTIASNVYQLYSYGKIESYELCDKFSELLLAVGV